MTQQIKNKQRVAFAQVFRVALVIEPYDFFLELLFFRVSRISPSIRASRFRRAARVQSSQSVSYFGVNVRFHCFNKVAIKFAEERLIFVGFRGEQLCVSWPPARQITTANDPCKTERNPLPFCVSCFDRRRAQTCSFIATVLGSFVAIYDRAAHILCTLVVHKFKNIKRSRTAVTVNDIFCSLSDV